CPTPLLRLQPVTPSTMPRRALSRRFSTLSSRHNLANSPPREGHMQTWLIIFCGMLALFALYVLIVFVPAAMIKRTQKADLRRRCAGKLVLSYDDGPGPLLTSPLLALLKSHNARASFYLVGFRAERFPETCDLIRTAGHDLGCHTHWHT